MAIAPLVKRPAGETRMYSMHLGFAKELREGGQMLVGTPTVTATAQGLVSGSSALTLGVSNPAPLNIAPAIQGSRVVVSIGGGTDLEDYLVTFTASLSGGGTIREPAILQVRAK